MNYYNGFSPQQRLRALKWLNAEFDAGRRTRPATCDACGQTEGAIECHSEDYSEPFGEHIGRYGVCHRCHMMIHCRFKNPEAWTAYKLHLRDGRIFAPIGRNYWLFCQQTLDAKGDGVPFKQGPAKGRTFLDDLTAMSMDA
ncbi:MAG: hypothetical protein WA231_18480 [Methylocella sp.]